MNCPLCGKRKTEKNTYRRGSGPLTSYCKECDKATSTRSMVIRQAKAGGGKRWLTRKIEQTEATLDLYRDILKNWS